MKARWITDHDTEEIVTELVLGCHLAEIDDVYASADAEAGVRITEDEARWLYELLKARFDPPATRISIPGLDPAKWLDTSRIGVTGGTITPTDGSIAAVNVSTSGEAGMADTAVADTAPQVVTDLRGVTARMREAPMGESALAMNRFIAHDACDRDEPVIEEAVLVIHLLREELERMDQRG